jgi:hypothetical protein
MEQAHWLNRKRASIAMAKKAVSAAARLIHYDLAGRYGVKAAAAATPQLHLEDAPPPEVTAGLNPQARSRDERS